MKHILIGFVIAFLIVLTAPASPYMVRGFFKVWVLCSMFSLMFSKG